MNDYHYRHFLVRRGVMAKLLATGLLTGSLFIFIGIAVALTDATLGLAILGVWVLFMVIYAIAVVTANIPKRKGAVRTSAVMKAGFGGPARMAGRWQGSEGLTENMRTSITEKPVNLKAYILEKKKNHNVFICGIPGSGKSLLTRYLLEEFSGYQKIIFNFKARDVYLSLGESYPILKMSESAPNPFTDSEAFTNAFLTTFAISSPGIQGALIGSLVREGAKGAGSWGELGARLEAEKRKERDRNKQAAIIFIQTQAASLVSPISAIKLSEGNIVYDFSGLNEAQKTFYAEVLLRQIWAEIEQGRRREILLCIDEAHRLTRQGSYTIYARIAREIRAFGMLWATTQFYTDLGEVTGDFDTQFVFKTTKKEDLDALRAIDQKLSWAVSSMPKYIFTDAGYPDHIHYVVPEFRLYYTPEDKPPRYMQIADDGTHQAGKKPKIDFEEEAWALLSTKEADYISNMAKEIRKKHPEYQIKGREDRDVLKVRLLTAINKLISEGRVKSLQKEGKKMYYIPSKNISPEHKEMEEKILAELKARDITVIRVSKSGAGPYPDIETPDFNIEIETGKKHSIKDLKARLGASKETVIVLPTDEVASRYLRLKKENVHIVGLEDFESYLEQVAGKRLRA